MGDGFSCTGNLLQVLQATPTFSNFLTVSLAPLQGSELCSCVVLLQRLVSPQQILNYSAVSEAGRHFVERLRNLEVRSTLLVPDNSGLPENQVSPAHPPPDWSSWLCLMLPTVSLVPRQEVLCSHSTLMI